MVLDKSWPPLAPAYAQVNGQWQLTHHIWGPRLRQHLESQVQTIQRQQREQEALQSRNQPSSAEVQTLPASGPGSRAASLGPHANGSGAVAAAPTNSGGTTAKTGLGEDVDKLAAKSPSLQKDWQKLKGEGWAVQYGPMGKGSYAQRGRNPTIVIDSALKGHPEAATQTFAHEVGHATYEYKPDYSSKSAYVDARLADEGAATMNNIKVQREIITNGGPDIGIAGNRANHAAYNQAYNQFQKDGDATVARQAIGGRFGKEEITSTTKQPYADYYGGDYEKAFPPKK